MIVEVRDRICGDGKTTDMLKEVKESFLNGADDKYIIITPYLKECHSIAGTEAIEDDDYQRPVTDSDGKIVYSATDRNLGIMRFKHPSFNNKEGSKEASLKHLMSNNHNIVSTHNLFLNVKLDTLKNASNYTLIVDEALDVFSVCSLLPRKETKKLLKVGILYLMPDNITLQFNRELFGDMSRLVLGEDAVKDTRYEEVAALCDNKQILLVNGNVLLWELSAEILKKFKRVVILTYLFEGREMSVYLNKHSIPYTVNKGSKGGKDVAHLIEIIDDKKLNAIGDEYYSLSVSSTKVNKDKILPPDEDDYDGEDDYKTALKEYKENKKEVAKKNISAEDVNDQLRRNLKNVMHNRWKAKKDDRFFTCISSNEKKIADKSFKGEWLGFSTKATNDYREKHHIAFLMNVFMQPYLKKVCDSTEFKINEDLVALSHLVQFVFRSALREDEPVKIYLPSIRMRELFERWLKGEFDE